MDNSVDLRGFLNDDDVLVSRKALMDLQFLARRYCDFRHTYVTYEFNRLTQYLIEIGVDLEHTDGIIWARDGSGRDYDHLSTQQSTPDTPEALGKR